MVLLATSCNYRLMRRDETRHRTRRTSGGIAGNVTYGWPAGRPTQRGILVFYYGGGGGDDYAGNNSSRWALRRRRQGAAEKIESFEFRQIILLTD